MEKQGQKFTVSSLHSTTWRLYFTAGKTPNGQKKKGGEEDTKILNPVMRKYTSFWHFAAGGIQNFTIFIYYLFQIYYQ